MLLISLYVFLLFSSLLLVVVDTLVAILSSSLSISLCRINFQRYNLTIFLYFMLVSRPCFGVNLTVMNPAYPASYLQTPLAIEGTVASGSYVYFTCTLSTLKKYRMLTAPGRKLVWGNDFTSCRRMSTHKLHY
jgi:hypothetical protein